MTEMLSRFLNESILLKIILFPRTFLYRLFAPISPRLRRMADSSYFFFFIRHPKNIRFKDYGLLLLAFELSFGLGRFMMNTLTPARRNACILLGFLALLAIGPLDRLQARRGGKVFSLAAPFGFIIAALGFGFAGSLIAPPVFNSIMIFLAILCICLHSPLWGLGTLLALLALIPWQSVALLLFCANLIRMYKRSADQKEASPLSGRAFFFLLWVFCLLGFVLLLPSPFSGLPWLPLLFAYPIATDAQTRPRRIWLFLCAVTCAALCLFYPAARTPSLILTVTVFLGCFPQFMPSRAIRKG